MKASEKKIITAFLDKTLNMSADTVASLFEKNGDDEELKSDAGKTLEDADAARVQSFKDKEKTLFDNGYKKAQGEVLSKLEKEVSEKFDIKSDKKGVELIEEIVSAKAKLSDLDEEKVKVHPAYLKAEKEFQKKLKEQEDTFKTQSEAKEKENARKESIARVRKSAVDKLNTDIKPIFGTTDEAKIQKQIDRLLMSEVEKFDFLEQDGETIVMTKEGKRLEDKHGKAISFDAFIKDIATANWELQTGESREGSGADKAAAEAAAKAAAKTTWKGKLPANEQEYSEVFKTLKTAEERIAFDDAYTTSKATKV